MPGTTKYVDAQEILKYFQAEVSTLKVDEDLATAGVDSFAVMRLCDEIGNEIGLEVNPTSVFQWGNCAKFAEGLKELIANPDAKPVSGAPAAPAAPTEAPKPAAAETKPVPSGNSTGWVEAQTVGKGTTGLPIVEINGKKFNLVGGATELPPFVVEAPEDSVENLMKHLGMESYAAPMIEEGYDDVKIIQILEDEEFDELCNDIAKMKKGHYRKFKMWKDCTNMKVAGTWEDYRRSLGIDIEALHAEAERYVKEMKEKGIDPFAEFEEHMKDKEAVDPMKEPEGVVG